MKNMEVLRAIAAWRTPLLDALMEAVTLLGEEAVFLAIAMAVFWCVDKRVGRYLLAVAFSGLAIGQSLKITFRIPRPWQLDTSFPIVEAARAQATGYSFPSGHTQSAAGIFGAIACSTRRGWLKWVCVLTVLAVAFSRLYLGVHMPMDVLTSLAVGAAVVLAIRPVLQRERRAPGSFLRLWVVLTAVAVVYLLYAHWVRSSVQGELAPLDNAVKNGWCMLGGILGLLLADAADLAFLKFDTRAVWWAQGLKMVLGMALVIAVRAAFKAPLYALLGQGSGVADGIRYFLMVITAGILWPMSFRFFSRLGRRETGAALEG